MDLEETCGYSDIFVKEEIRQELQKRTNQRAQAQQVPAEQVSAQQKSPVTFPQPKDYSYSFFQGSYKVTIVSAETYWLLNIKKVA